MCKHLEDKAQKLFLRVVDSVGQNIQMQALVVSGYQYVSKLVG